MAKTYAEYAINDPKTTRYNNAYKDAIPAWAGFIYLPEKPQITNMIIPAISICNPTLNNISTGNFLFEPYTEPKAQQIVERIARPTPNANEELAN